MVRIVKSLNFGENQMVFLNVWNPACPLGKMSPAKTLRWSVAVTSEWACRAFTDGALGFPRYIEACAWKFALPKIMKSFIAKWVKRHFKDFKVRAPLYNINIKPFE